MRMSLYLIKRLLVPFYATLLMIGWWHGHGDGGKYWPIDSACPCITQSLAQGDHNFFAFNDILLAIHFNHPWYRHVPRLVETYRAWFPTIVFSGPSSTSADDPEPPDLVTCEHPDILAHVCHAKVMRKHPHARGYLFIHFDLLLSPWNLYSFHPSRIWIADAGYDNRLPLHAIEDNPWLWWKRNDNREKVRIFYDRLTTAFPGRLEKHAEGPGVIARQYVDAFHIPAKFRIDFLRAADIAEPIALYHEITIPTIVLYLTDRSKVQQMHGIEEWDREDALFMYTREAVYVHRIALQTNQTIEFLGNFCCEELSALRANNRSKDSS